MPANAAAVQKKYYYMFTHWPENRGDVNDVTLMVHARVDMDAWEGPQGPIWVPLVGCCGFKITSSISSGN